MAECRLSRAEFYHNGLFSKASSPSSFLVVAARPSPESCLLLFLSRRHFPSGTLLGFNGRKGGFTALKALGERRGLWEAASPLSQRLRESRALQQCRRMDGSPQTHGKPAGSATGRGWEHDRGCQTGAVNAQAVTITARCLHHPRAGAASPTDTAWARGRKRGSEAPPRLDCARQALGTRGSMGCKQPREPLRRGVNKGISQTVSELVPAGRRNGTIPIPAHNREQHYPTARLGKQETKGKGLLQGTAPACRGTVWWAL